MTKNTPRTLALILALIACLAPAMAQNRTQIGGARVAADYAFGRNGVVPPIRILTGNAAAGAATITVDFGIIALGDGTPLAPLSTTAPIVVGAGSTAETVTPSAVACTTPGVYGSCTLTATFTNAHGQGETIASGTYGLIEAVNAARAGGGGLVIVDARFTALGGATGTITGNKGFTNVTVLDWRGTTTAKSYTSGSNGANMAATAINLY